MSVDDTGRPGRRRVYAVAHRMLLELTTARDLASLAWALKRLFRRASKAVRSGWRWITGRRCSVQPPAGGETACPATVAGRDPGPAKTPAGLPARVRPAFPVRPLAVGPRADALFTDNFHDRDAALHQRDIFVADAPPIWKWASHPMVVLSEHPRLAVPAFDSRIHNPIGWRRHADGGVGCLGPRDQLPPGAAAHRTLKSTDLDLIRDCHHVEDVGGFHAGPVERAAALARLAATGAPVHVLDDDPQLEALLGSGLYQLMKTDVAYADATARELHSVRLRRAALQRHATDARLRLLCRAAQVEPPQLPGVSILLATRRPDFLPHAVAGVARQSYPRLELILALHGGGFAEDDVARAVAPLAAPVEVLRLAGERPFAEVLNAATDMAAGDLVTKMDDDDLYDAHHVWDLVLAHEYSAAHLVGKNADVVYLARRDQTVECRGSGCETYAAHVAGGTLLLSRSDLKAVGGWQGVTPYVDRTLIDGVAREGGRIYRTHSNGYVLVRHGRRHSWNAADEDFIAGADAVHSGFRPSVAGLDEVRPLAALPFNCGGPPEGGQRRRAHDRDVRRGVARSR